MHPGGGCLEVVAAVAEHALRVVLVRGFARLREHVVAAADRPELLHLPPEALAQLRRRLAPSARVVPSARSAPRPVPVEARVADALVSVLVRRRMRGARSWFKVEGLGFSVEGLGFRF